MTAWTAEQLDLLGPAEELEIAAPRRDGTLRAFTPIWVVCVAGDVFVRTWQRRETGWFGAAVRSSRARVRVPGLTVDVIVQDVGDLARAAVDDAYRTKYGRYGTATVGRMVSTDAAASTLRLTPADQDPTVALTDSISS